MKLSLFSKERRSPESIAISIVVHALAALGLAAITFHVPLLAILGVRQPAAPTPVRLTYVPVRASGPAVSAGPAGGGAPIRATVPLTPATPVPAPTSIPSALPPVPLPSAAAPVTGVAGGAGSPGSAVNPRTGVEPVLPDPRISLQTPLWTNVPKSMAAKTDSAIHAAFLEYRDAVVAAQAAPSTRGPGDWTVDRNGQKWGWDPVGIHLGKYTIPNAIFAALPTKMGPSGRSINALTDARMASWTQRDLAEHAGGMSEEDFRAAVKRIRERVDRERQEQGKAVPPAPVKPPE